MGKMPLNPVLAQMKQMEAQSQMDQQSQQQEQEDQQFNNNNPFLDDEENPFAKSFKTWFEEQMIGVEA